MKFCIIIRWIREDIKCLNSLFENQIECDIIVRVKNEEQEEYNWICNRESMVAGNRYKENWKVAWELIFRNRVRKSAKRALSFEA